MKAKTYRNYTLAECDQALARYEKQIRAGTMTFRQKFTCWNCWARIEADEPNKLFLLGHCQECGHVTDLQETGCNYSLLISVRS